MSKHDQTRNTSRAVAAKKPYQKPAFLRERAFETMALFCQKMGGTSQNCNRTPKFS